MLARLAPVALVLLAGCGAGAPYASDETVARVAYHDPVGPPSLTLYTVLNNRSGEGAHTALLVNASERVLFDPAGSFETPRAPERNDVLHGMSPAVVTAYEDYHARVTYHAEVQTVAVSPEVAEMALRAVEDHGAVPHAFCAQSTSGILQSLPGFESVGRTYFPKRLMREFAAIPGVTQRAVYDNDPDDHRAKLVGN